MLSTWTWSWHKATFLRRSLSVTYYGYCHSIRNVVWAFCLFCVPNNVEQLQHAWPCTDTSVQSISILYIDSSIKSSGHKTRILHLWCWDQHLLVWVPNMSEWHLGDTAHHACITFAHACTYMFFVRTLLRRNKSGNHWTKIRINGSELVIERPLQQLHWVQLLTESFW